MEGKVLLNYPTKNRQSVNGRRFHKLRAYSSIEIGFCLDEHKIDEANSKRKSLNKYRSQHLIHNFIIHLPSSIESPVNSKPQPLISTHFLEVTKINFPQ